MWERFGGFGTCILLACSSAAQLIAPGAPIPRTSKPPVVFVNGYERSCPASFVGTFGIADQILQSNGEASVFFDNCTVSESTKPPIETLGAAFGTFLCVLKYTGGTAVDTVDVVAHSMGGLIVRSYLSGKQTTSGMFDPPAATHIRKAVIIATPHFGTGLASTVLGAGVSDAQLQEMASGSIFLFDLATWNQDSDDLRGIDAVGVVGNGGTGLATTSGFDDGVVALTSASLGFYAPGRTRVVPYCHVQGGGLITFGGLCGPNAIGVANMNSATHETAQIMVSFLNGDTTWQTVGTAAELDHFLSTNGGLIVEARTSNNAFTPLTAVTAQSPAQTKNLNITSGEAVAIYGSNLADSTVPATSLPLLMQLSDAQVLVNGAAIPLYYASA